MIPGFDAALPALAQRACAVLVALSIVSGSAIAEADDRAVARARFEAGKKAYEAREYRAAIAEFKAAMHPSPLLVYNIARCHEKLGEWEEAARVYRGYLRQFPDAPDRLAVATRIRELEEVVRQLGYRRGAPSESAGTAAPLPAASPRAITAAAVPAGAVSPTPALLRDHDERWRPPASVVWIALGVAVAAAGTGTYFGVRALDRNATDDASVAAGRGATASFVVGGVAAAVAAAALTWRLVVGKRARATAVGLAPGSAFALVAF